MVQIIARSCSKGTDDGRITFKEAFPLPNDSEGRVKESPVVLRGIQLLTKQTGLGIGYELTRRHRSVI